MIVPVNRERLLQRFLQYVQIGTSADPHSETYPSSPQQKDLSRVLAEQLVALGVADAHMDDHGLVWGTVPANVAGAPAIALNSHVDTSPEAPGDDVKPQVIVYQGGDIPLPEDNQVIRVADCPELADLVGKTLITTDGTTLLGGDDKAGVAIIMELVATLIENPQLPHGPVKILFSCDEEIGHGTDKIDLAQLDAVAAYTLDGGGAGDLDVETFSADGVLVTFTGRNIHPSIGKGRMVNATRAAGFFLQQLPDDSLSPESTDGRDGFIHPYEIEGGVGRAELRVLLRSFDTAELTQYADRLRQAATATEQQYPGLAVRVEVKPQYRNMADGLRENPRVADLAEQAFRNLGRPVRRSIIRGGTDGSALTEKGLPTPNLSSGQHAIHSLHEFACLEEMIEAVEHLQELLRLWSETTE
ncbi:peptidase T [Rosistilla oblonga]|uniref:Peptidase T n=1 Tax=Rosistilla oblonga TaxID=2527990 RepID=A0A518IRA9_9BACT|nr:peptidase T [Rosistilla oblonga]QDV55628.1 Peptidase T [Rosistilla oblonga]